jgi:hypothetical protein
LAGAQHVCLGEALGVFIENVERERAAGSFSVDLVGEDHLGNSVVLEISLSAPITTIQAS